MQITEAMIAKWSYCFPDVNIVEELRIMEAWLDRHPARRASKRFAENWLAKAQRQSSQVKREARVGEMWR